MRLLHSATRTLYEFTEDSIPPYAILSHTWGSSEVSFQDLKSPLTPTILAKEGYQKIASCCETALADGFEYTWIDTCCIDKSSSSELSEAINSMYSWYEKAEVCYAYVSDYPYTANKGVPGASFGKSRWFTRGWTLQELLAPSNVVFFNKEWKEIGTRSSLREMLEGITGIHVEALMGKSLRLYSVAQRMSWASRRETTRSEDLAYCLMGIFGVNMPMLYGEGKKAFLRLQEAIMMKSTDRTLFAWENKRTMEDNLGLNLLAETPAYFRDSGNIVRAKGYRRRPFAMTNNGVQFEMRLIKMKSTLPSTDYNTQFLAVLDCQHAGQSTTLIALSLYRISDKDNTFYVNPINRLVEVTVAEREKHDVTSFSIVQLDNQKHLPTHHEYKRIVVNIVGLQTLKIVDCVPALSEGDAASTISISKVSRKRVWGGLILRDQELNGCAIMLHRGTVDHGVEVTIEEINQKVQLSHVLHKLEATSVPGGVGTVLPDRIYWQHPAKWCVSVTVRRKIIQAEKVIEVTIQEGI